MTVPKTAASNCDVPKSLTRLYILLDQSKAAIAAMTPAEREAMYVAQRASFVRAEAGFGSDADEAAYRQALTEGDEKTLVRLRAGAKARMEAFDIRQGETP